jgi:hypothetical protein
MTVDITRAFYLSVKTAVDYPREAIASDFVSIIQLAGNSPRLAPG